MNKKALINGALAFLYIVLISLLMYLGSKNAPKEDSFVAPIAFISLFTLSAATMAYLFGYLPATYYLDGHKKQAVNLFLQTVAIFAGLTIVTFIVLLSGVFS